MLTLLIDPAIGARLPVPTRRWLRRRLARMARAAWLSEATERDLEVAVRITDDPGIRELSRTYRDKDSPTDVLAFAAREAPGMAHLPEVLGDIVISLDTAERQARAEVTAEILVLAAHGLCHLLGYDHQDDEEERVMNHRMQALLAESGRRGPTRPA